MRDRCRTCDGSLVADPHIHLQGFSRGVKARPARDLRTGDVLMWNGGGTSTVVDLKPKGKQSLVVTEEWESHTLGLQSSDRTLRLDRLVAVGRLEGRRWRAVTEER